MEYKLGRIAAVISSSGFDPACDCRIKWIAVDSRKIFDPAHTLFFALKGSHTDGHSFIRELIKKGLKNFVVQADYHLSPSNGIAYVRVKNVLEALQLLGQKHRNLFSYPVLAITGSNGKTTIKEWLIQLLGNDYNLVATPKSYNSQIGVPLSVWGMNHHHELGIFEAGISQTGEMEKLEKILQPDIGILTNLGPAHDAFFSDRTEKLEEKLKLFYHTKQLILCADQLYKRQTISILSKINPSLQIIQWSYLDPAADIWYEIKSKDRSGSKIIAHFKGEEYAIKLPFTETELLENAGHCMAFVLLMDSHPLQILPLFKSLSLSPLRLELKSAINQCSLIYDCYNSDLQSLGLALGFMNQQAGNQSRTLIFSDILQSGQSSEKLYAEVIKLMLQYRIKRFIGIGHQIASCQHLFSKYFDCSFFEHTEQLLSSLSLLGFQNECILLKGARAFKMETIGLELESMSHSTVLEINLSAMAYNLNWFRSKLKEGVKTMVMLKAAAYGSGIGAVSRLLEFHGIDYIGVAYADEGLLLRQEGVKTPIMVMNSAYHDFSNLLKYRLEPQIYSLNQLKTFITLIPQAEILPVHLKINTGMNRLGFDESDLQAAIETIQASGKIEIKSILTHLAGSEVKELDAFTKRQLQRFEKMYAFISEALSCHPMKQVLNTGGIIRFSDYQFDMVRLGIGLYGVDPTGICQDQLENLFSLRSIVAQIRSVEKGESIGYSASYYCTKRTRIATLSIGYADGYPRSLSNGKGRVLIKGKLYPVVGNICMDMCMVDIGTEDYIREGDRVNLFGSELTVIQLARWAGIIPYEMIAGLSSRIRRVYYEE